MRVVVIGASGNVGTSLLEALAREERVREVVGVARRVPEARFAKASWRTADIADPNTDLAELMRGADCVVHLAWLIQPSRDETVTYATNVKGSARVFEAAGRAGVPAIVYASSIGTYAPSTFVASENSFSNDTRRTSPRSASRDSIRFRNER